MTGVVAVASRCVFRAMGVEVELLAEARPAVAAEAFAEVEREFERLEAMCSRFRADSELTLLNERGRAEVGPDLLAVASLAVEARERTGGRFDPTVHDALAAAGYDRTFDEIPPDGPVGPSAAPGPCAGRVEVDAGRSTISLEPGFRLDLGGIAKGFAVDRACDLLERIGPCLVNAGGDLAVRGAPEGGPWPVGVDTPAGSLTLGLTRGAIATSGRDARRWRRGGVERHHLIDPRTGAPSDSDLLRVTAVGRTAVEAEVLAKSLFLAGSEAAEAEADAAGVPCVLVARDGRVRRGGGLA